MTYLLFVAIGACAVVLVSGAPADDKQVHAQFQSTDLSDALLRSLLDDFLTNLDSWNVTTSDSAIIKQRKHLKGTRALIEAQGYPAEDHVVVTEDGYILSMFRIPRPDCPPVFLMHGLLASSADYVVLGKHRALASVLYEAGFDVWLGNARGTTESRRHKTLVPGDAKFWDFSWHEIGSQDLPALIDHVLNATNQTSLHYVGHSQGTTTFFVMGSERQEYMAKVKTFVALAPIAFVNDIRSIPVRLMAVAPNALGDLIRLMGANEFLPNSKLVSWLGDTFCADGDITQPLCYDIMFLIGGTDSQQMNATAIPDILANTPAGAATKQLIHYGQLIAKWRQEFRQYDHGWLGNLFRYQSLSPPEYNLSKISATTYLFTSDNDLLSVKKNVEELVRRLPSIAPDGVKKVPFRKFNHLDYIFGKNAKELVYNDIVKIIRRHDNNKIPAF
ncbi:lipase 3-like [Frankliniella occidentalis]|uniref:Lipase 3-like n=1 Tax=Frankliniella occidentalis TaxID=133901 RepID=A0A9C6X6Z3_FRAOC|nr:lipase 3-like [Frankliniella occidentalis]